MKRSEIKIGDRLFWATGADWETSDRDTAVVEVTGLWAKKTTYRRPGQSMVQDVPEGSSGAGIKVKIITSSSGFLGDPGRERCAQLAHLRGHWGVVEPYRVECKRVRQGYLDRTERDKRLREEKAFAIRDRARVLLGDRADLIERHGERDFRVTRKTMELLLDLAAGVEVVHIDPQTGEVLSRSWEE